MIPIGVAARLRLPVVLLSVAAGVLFAGARVGAQEIGASVTGTVTDQQGAVLPGVTVTVINLDTNVPAETVTNSQGLYVLQKLIPGRYKVTAALQGFKTY